MHLVLTDQLNHLASLAKWLSVRLRIKWLWVRMPLQSPGMFVIPHISSYTHIYQTHITQKLNISLYNHGKNIRRIFHILTQFPFTTSEEGTTLLSPKGEYTR